MATETNGNLGNVVRFGVYEVDPRAGELRRNGVKIKLQEQPFQVLTILLERPGELVSREEMQRRLWPADTFVDFDHSLNAAIKRLRDALQDSADNPRFVETLARRGYRFVAPVAGALPANGNADSRERPRKRSLARWATGTLVLVGACISVGWHLGHRTAGPLAPQELRITANSSDVPVYWAAISHDGRYLAYSDPRGIYVREVSADESHFLTLPEGFRVHQLSWFPDGSHLLAAAVAGPMERSSLWKVSLLGGAPRRVADDFEMGTVSPDGKRVALLRADKFSHSEIWLMNSDGSESRKAATVEGFVVGPPVWSPDGKRLAYLKDVYWPGHGTEEVRIEAYELASGKTNLILADYRLQEGIVWTPDDRIVFSRTEEPPVQGESNLWSVRVDSRTGRAWGNPQRLTSGPDWKPLMNASADGKRTLYIRTNIAPTVYVTEVDPKKREIGRLERLTLDERQNRPYEWTPDGKAVLYVSDREGAFHIFRQEVGAAAPELLVGGQDSAILLRLNPEGTEILYSTAALESRNQQSNGASSEQTSGSNGSSDTANFASEFHSRAVRLMRAPISGGAGQMLLEDAGISNFQCARAPARECLFSRFAKDALVFVAFDSKSGERKELFRVGDPDWQQYNWSLRPDGKMLVLAKKMRASTSTEIKLVHLNGGAERVIPIKDWAGIGTIDWAADGKSMWASAIVRGESRAMLNIDLQGNAKAVLQENKPYVGWAIPSQDGKRLAIWEASGGSNVWMLEGH